MGGGGAGGRRRRRRRAAGAMSDINITPFVDVMLVLLIIFMVAAPLLSVGFPVDLPKTAANELPNADERVVLSVTAEGTVFLGEEEVPLEALPEALREAVAGQDDPRIFLRGDRAAAYGAVMAVMDVLQAEGLVKIGLETDRGVSSAGGGADGDATP